MNTLNKINTVDDLINLLYTNRIFFEFYKKYKTQAFLQLLKKESFKKSFNEMFIIIIATNDISGIKSFLKLYPIGTLSTDNELNKIQIYTYENINENLNELLIEKYPLQIQSGSGSGIGSKIGNVLLKAYNSEAGKQLSEQLIKESSNVASNTITKASTKINEKLASK